MMITSLTPETTTLATRLATTAVSSTTTTSDLLVPSVNIAGNRGMKVSGNMSHRFIPMQVARDLRFKSTTKISTPSTIWRRVYPARARVTTTTSMTTTTSRKKIVYTPRARVTITTTRGRQFVPYPYFKDRSVSQVKVPEKGTNLTRFVKPLVPEITRKN
jgi:hypothetical protein